MIITERVEAYHFRPFQAYYLSLRDINTTVSTWQKRPFECLECTFEFSRASKYVDTIFLILLVQGNMSTIFGRVVDLDVFHVMEWHESIRLMYGLDYA